MSSWSYFLVILPAWALMGNLLVVISVYKNHLLHNLTNYFVVNLAIADLMIAVIAMPFHIYVPVNGKWDLGDLFCDISLSIDCFCVIVSKFTLVAISVDRFIAVTQPIRYRSLQSKYQRVVLLISLIWLTSLAMTIPLLFGVNSTPDRISTICTFYNTKFYIIASIFTFWIPGFLLVLVYFKLVRAIGDRMRKFSIQKPTVEVPGEKNFQPNLLYTETYFNATPLLLLILRLCDR